MVEQISPSRKRDQVKSALMWKFTKSEIENALSRMERLKSLIQCALTEDLMALSQAIRGDVVFLRERTEQLYLCNERLQTHANQELQNRLSRWLGLPDPSTNYHTALEKRHPETGQWLLNEQPFDDWKKSISSLMWLHGNAGCGKTILSAAALQRIIQHQQSQVDTAVTYFYFDFNDVEKQSSRKAARSLLFQLAQQVPDGLQDLEHTYHTCRSGHQQPAEDVIRSLLRGMIDRIDSKYIILDALDECTDRENLLTFVSELVESKCQGLHILATSRREKDIEEQLRPVADYNINIQNAVVDHDIRVYVRDRLITDPKLKRWPQSVQDEITTVMMEKADGMFRWVYCQLESIRQCIQLSALRQALSSLPKTLDETYDRVLHHLESIDQLQDAITALRSLCYSNRPLRLLELREVLAVKTGDDGGFFPEERLPDPADIMVVCSSLVSFSAIDDDIIESRSVDTGLEQGRTTEIRLAHFSVKEYLLSDRCAIRSEFQLQVCHRDIAEGCLRYLLSLSEHGPLTEVIVDEHPLALYAAKYWWHHSQEVDHIHRGVVFDLASKLLTNASTALLTWIQLYDPDYDIRKARTMFFLLSNDLAQPLYYAALLGLPEVVQNILPRTTAVNAQGGTFGTALQAASAHGHERVVLILLDNGADINAQGGRYGNALQSASRGGYERVVQILLDSGADINAEGGMYGNVLQAVSANGHERVVQMLLDSGADVNAQGEIYSNALQANGHKAVVRSLLDAGFK